jgi:hypothetical protein
VYCKEKLEQAKAAEVSKAVNFLKSHWKGFRSARKEDFENSSDTSVRKNCL